MKSTSMYIYIWPVAPRVFPKNTSRIIEKEGSLATASEWFRAIAPSFSESLKYNLEIMRVAFQKRLCDVLTTASEYKKWRNVDTSDQNSLDCVVYECTQPKYRGGHISLCLDARESPGCFSKRWYRAWRSNTQKGISLCLERGRWVIREMKDVGEEGWEGGRE